MITVAVALVGIYILFALIASHIAEVIGALFRQRGKQLYDGILALVGDGVTVARAAGLNEDQAKQEAAKYARDLVDAMYAHPLVSNLSEPKKKPTYIPARTFTLSFLDEFRKVFQTDANGTTMTVPDLLATPDALLSDIVQRVGGLPDGSLKQTLTTLLQTAGRDYDNLLHSIDSLFDASMQRVSGWYKRWSAVVVAIIGAVLVGIFNIDTLAIVQQLTSDSTKAQALANAAQHLTTGTDFQSLIASASDLKFGWSVPPNWGLKILGLVISWFAVMLGAPFWFDLLQRVVPVRLTGDKPAVTAIKPSSRDVADVQSASTDPSTSQ